MGFGMMGGGGIFGLLILGLLVYLFITLFNNNKGNQSSSQNNNINGDALETLKIRYAKGEISEEEYLKKKEILKD